MDVKPKIKFAVVGLGHIGMRHISHILANDNSELVAVCDIIDKTKEIEQFNINNCIQYFDNIEDLLVNTNADVINVCTPNFLHAYHTEKSLQFSKHVVCEKPMAMSVAECDRMIKASEKANKNIFVVKQNRYNPPVQQVKNLIENKSLGKILMININCFWNRNDAYYTQSDWRGSKQKDGGCLFTQFSHFVDILYYLFGICYPISSLMKNAMHPNIAIEDNGICTLISGEGALVNFNFSTCSFEKNMEGAFTIIAEKGTVKIGGQYLNTIEYQNIKDIQLPEINITAKNNDYGLYQGSMSNHDKMIENVINTLHGKDSIMTNAYEGRDVVKMIEGMYAASKIKTEELIEGEPELMKHLFGLLKLI